LRRNQFRLAYFRFPHTILPGNNFFCAGACMRKNKKKGDRESLNKTLDFASRYYYTHLLVFYHKEAGTLHIKIIPLTGKINKGWLCGNLLLWPEIYDPADSAQMGDFLKGWKNSMGCLCTPCLNACGFLRNPLRRLRG